jgi:hypothetical protein
LRIVVTSVLTASELLTYLPTERPQLVPTDVPDREDHVLVLLLSPR